MAKTIKFFIKLAALLLAVYVLNGFAIDDDTIKMIIDTVIFYFKKIKILVYQYHKQHGVVRTTHPSSP